MKRLILTACLLAPSLVIHAAGKPAKPRAEIGSTAPAGKPYVYKTSAGKPRQMEIYFPPNHDPAKARVPGMILFHGGAWGGGSLGQFRIACAYFASRGLVCATAEYQMLSAADAKKLPAGETRKRVCVTDAKSAIRTIFRQLASALHPDREPDEQERLRKTALMSEVNAAYEKNDLTTLLRLQMQVAQVNPQNKAGTARMADDKLIAMSLLLKEQVAALEEDLDQLESRLSRELCVPVRAEADEAVMNQSLQRLQADQRYITDTLAADLRRIQNEAELKRWLKEQWQLAKATSA